MTTNSAARYLLGLLLVLTGVAWVSSAEASDSFRYGLGKNNQIFTNENSAITGGYFELQIKGGVPATIKLDLVDIYANESGLKQPLPINSSPFTPLGFVDYPETVANYQPSSDFQTIEIPFRFKNISDLTRPILGGIKISIVTEGEEFSNVRVVSSIVATFAYYPVQASKELKNSIKPKLDLARPQLSQLTKEVAPFNLLPNLPRIYNKSPLQAEITVKNVGNIFLNTKTRLVVVEPRFLALAPPRSFSSLMNKSCCWYRIKLVTTN